MAVDEWPKRNLQKLARHSPVGVRKMIMNANDQAFPVATSIRAFEDKNDEHRIFTEPGLTKREWLAGIICAGFCSNKMLMEGFAVAAKDQQTMNLAIGIESVRQADALIAALNQQPK